MENKSIKEEWINGIVMISPRPQYNHMQIEGKIYPIASIRNTTNSLS